MIGQLEDLSIVTLDEILGPEMADFVLAVMRGVRRRARAEGATPEEAGLAGLEAGYQWCDALLDGETLFDLGPVNPATGDPPRGWQRFHGLPDFEIHIVRHARKRMLQAAEQARKDQAKDAPANRSIELAWQIRQLTLGG